MTRRNLCPNPFAKTNATGYSGTAAATRSTGLSGFQRTTGMIAAGGGYIQAPVAACAPGDQIVVSLQTVSLSVLGTKTIYCAFTRSAGGDDFSQTFTVTADTTVRRAVFNGTAPANATGVYLILDAITAGTVMSSVMYEPGAVDGGYADGDSSGWVWDGTNGNSSSTQSGGTDLPVSGTLSGGGTLSGTVQGRHTATGALAGGGHLTGVVSGGDVPNVSGTQYDLNDIFDGLAAVFNGVYTGDTIGGVAITMEAHSEVPGQVDTPSIVLELDGQTFNINMGNGADSFNIVALVLLTDDDTQESQRALRSFLSRKSTSGLLRLQAALEADQTLGGLVSYAIMTGVRDVGHMIYGGVDYLGAELIIEVVS